MAYHLRNCFEKCVISMRFSTFYLFINAFCINTSRCTLHNMFSQCTAVQFSFMLTIQSKLNQSQKICVTKQKTGLHSGPLWAVRCDVHYYIIGRVYTSIPFSLEALGNTKFSYFCNSKSTNAGQFIAHCIDLCSIYVQQQIKIRINFERTQQTLRRQPRTSVIHKAIKLLTFYRLKHRK